MGCWRVGFMYDIACQTHRSMVKWGFLADLLPRLDFAVSVFHAYGHNWVCQLWYHPRKQKIWGLSDGEGTERLWSDIRKLIPGLRVTGHHRRLFILDLQMEYRRSVKLEGSAKWLVDRVKSAFTRLDEAQKRLDGCGCSLEDLRREWDAQRAHQSKVLTRQSKKAGIRAVEKILELRQSYDAMEAAIADSQKELETLLATDDGHSHGSYDSLRADLLADIESKRATATYLDKQAEQMTSQLALTNQVAFEQLNTMKKDRWFELVMNMRALKARLIAKLRYRQFEVANISRVDRSSAMGKFSPLLQVLQLNLNLYLSCLCRSQHSATHPRCSEPSCREPYGTRQEAQCAATRIGPAAEASPYLYRPASYRDRCRL